MPSHDKSHRAHQLLLQARELGQGLFDSQQNLIRSENPHVPSRYLGHIVVQQSLEYGIALLETLGDVGAAQREEDIATADAIVNRVLDYQVRDPRHFRYGNFLWMTHWTEPLDPNAAAFVTPPLVYLYRKHAGHLRAQTMRRLEEAFVLLAQALTTREVPYEYTNIKFLTTACQFLLAPLLPDSQIENIARFQWVHTVGFTAQYGFAEYNSPTYLPVFMEALELMWEHGPEDLKQEFQNVLEYAYFEFAARYHAPSGYLAGAMSRAYPPDVETGGGLGGLVAHLQWGTPYKMAHLNGVRWALSSYEAPPQIRSIAFEKKLPLEIRSDIWNRVPVRRTDYFAPEFSLGSQDGYFGNQEIPLFATVRHDQTQSGRRSLWLEPTVKGWAALASRQADGEVAGYYFFDRQMVRDGALIRGQGGETPLGLRWRLGDKAFLTQVRLGGRDWDGKDQALGRSGTVVARAGEVCIGLAWQVDEDATPGKGDDLVQLAWERDELVLKTAIFPTAEGYVRHGKTLGMRFYLRMAPCNETSGEVMEGELRDVSFDGGSEVAFSKSDVQVQTASKQFVVKAPDEFYLHESALAAIKPNDLLLWFQGKDEEGRELLWGSVHE